MIVYLPLEPIEMRYTTHLDNEIHKYLKKSGKDFIRLEPNVLSTEIKNGSFLDADNTVYRQFDQFQQLIKGLLNGTIPKDSTLFISDLWNFGVMAIPYLNYFGNYNLKIKGIIHAGSFTDTDFVRDMERYYKGFEDIIFDICDEIFVGSHFIKKDLIKKRVIDAKKVTVTKLPLDAAAILGVNEKFKYAIKKNRVIFNGRNVDEKQPWLFDMLKDNLPNYEFINTHEHKYSKSTYYEILKTSKCVVSFALQENFGYGIQEAVALGCVPVVPNRLAYLEQFDSKYRYKTFQECIKLVEQAIEGKLPIPYVEYQENDMIYKTWFKN